MFNFRSARAPRVLVILFVTLACKSPERSQPAAPVIVQPKYEGRWIEPRLSFSRQWSACKRSQVKGRILDQVVCGAYQSDARVSPYEVCETMTTSHAATLRTLITTPSCTDAVIDRLTVLAGRNRSAPLLSDLAAAYYVRAQKEDRLSDLFSSLRAGQQAVAADSRFAPAQYNLALAQESLGFTQQASVTWKTAATLDDTGWASEARTRGDEIDRKSARDAAVRWSLNKERLPEVIRLGDRNAAEQLIAPFPAATQRYVEEEILPAWAETPNPEKLQEATVIADVLRKITGDAFLSETVHCATTARGATLLALREGHRQLGLARQSDNAFKPKEATARYRSAVQSFERAGSPLRMAAQLGIAIQIVRFDSDKRPAAQQLSKLDAEASRRHYLNLWARILSNRANLAHIEGRYLETLALYDQALGIFNGLNDEEGQANVHARKAGTLRILGNDEGALREIFLARPHAAKLVEMRYRHLLAGESGKTALALGFPQPALEYQSAFIDALQREMANPRASEPAKQSLRLDRAIALRGRAEIWLALDQASRARAELEEAIAISKGQSDDKLRNGLLARIAEVRGKEAMARGNPAAAVEAFTEARLLSQPVGYRTLSIALLIERAGAHQRAGNARAASEDLTQAITELTAEETALLDDTKKGQNEGIWSDYFSRFQEAYQLLIEQLIERGQKEEAFAYAEKSRAFEPLKRVRDLGAANPRSRMHDERSVNPRALAEIRADLPPGTFLLEYQVGEHQTFVWVFSHDDFEMLTLPVARDTVKEWGHALQRDAVNRNVESFEKGLFAPYAALFSEALARIATMKNGTTAERRLVIIPDRFMHGLPFAALRNSRRYLVEDFPISVSASASLYLNALERDRQLAATSETNPKALLVGDPAFDMNLELARGLVRLPSARTQEEEAAALYGPKARVLIDKTATVAAFLEHAKNSAIIDIAGHAVVNRHPPFGALLLMAPAKGNSGLLYADELLTKLELDKARLVVLGACSSAGGVPVGPEGLAPLVRPIVIAGVPAIVGSLWTIGDSQSKKILIEFHRNYRNGHDSARALQLAQIRFLTERNVAMPVTTWAPFQTIGFASSPFPRSADIERRAP